MKIEQENLAFARRLIQRKGQINLKQMSDDYDRHCYLRDRIKKLPATAGNRKTRYEAACEPL